MRTNRIEWGGGNGRLGGAGVVVITSGYYCFWLLFRHGCAAFEVKELYMDSG